jgi:hypothetical protein
MSIRSDSQTRIWQLVSRFTIYRRIHIFHFHRCNYEFVSGLRVLVSAVHAGLGDALGRYLFGAPRATLLFGFDWLDFEFSSHSFFGLRYFSFTFWLLEIEMLSPNKAVSAIPINGIGTCEHPKRMAVPPSLRFDAIN